jgi:outer membrane protein assembly factor BamD (BamD/ComL family)
MKKLIILIALVTLTSCSNNDDNTIVEAKEAKETTESFYFETDSIEVFKSLPKAEFHSFKYTKGSKQLTHGYYKNASKTYEVVTVQEIAKNELFLDDQSNVNNIFPIKNTYKKMYFFPTEKRLTVQSIDVGGLVDGQKFFY